MIVAVETVLGLHRETRHVLAAVRSTSQDASGIVVNSSSISRPHFRPANKSSPSGDSLSDLPIDAPTLACLSAKR